MNPFLSVVDLSGAAVGMDVIAAALPGLGSADGRAEVVFDGCWAGALVPAGQLSRPAIAQRHGIVVVGTVRLTNRRTLPGARAGAGTLGDLNAVIDHYLRRGTAGVRDLIGDFAFVLWDSRRNLLLAARDALGVKPLFFQQHGSRLVVASHLECFETGQYDTDFIGHFLIGAPSATSRTIFSGITRLKPGSMLVARGQSVTVETYWSAAEFVPTSGPRDEAEAAEEFRRLFEEAVTGALEDGVPAWGHLSGGLDSSSVIGMASLLASQGKISRGLAGTVTVVDSLAEGDETRYSNTMVERYGLRNERVTDYWAWQADEKGAPGYREPQAFLPFYARNREINRIVRDGGGQVVLSGFGSDHYLAGRDLFVADLIASGRIKAAISATTDLAVATRQSFWRLGFQNGVYPLLPASLQRRWKQEHASVPSWITPELAKRCNLQDKLLRLDQPTTGHGRCADAIATEMECLDLSLERGISEEGLEMRYPFLHRPLVEFGLALPPILRARPNQAKWILREALKDVLPEKIRTRPGKGGIDGRIVWSFQRERPVLEKLVTQSHLAELGLVRREALAAALQAACRGQVVLLGPLFVTLAMETWFAVRSGWWSHNVGQSPSVAQALFPTSRTQWVGPQEEFVYV
ncbi:MAG: asparagine synthase-related protein [Gemmatimonadota bacterium]